MKIPVQKSPISSDQVFEIKYLKEQHFDPNWHFHSEYQLFMVLKGTGTRFIGDHVKPFRGGDVVFTGPDLPHLWRSDHEYFEGNQNLWTEGIVVYFHEDFMGDQFLHKTELHWIRQLFVKARRGLEITGQTAALVNNAMADILTLKDFDRVIALLAILNTLAHTKEYSVLASEGYSNSLNASDTARMNNVHAHVLKHFRERLTLDAVAKLANMTPTSFSRYFKTHANKTFSAFLTEIRIGHACKLLIEKNMDVAQTCYESGFNTLSNFNRQFKMVTKLSPIAYKKVFNQG